MKYKGCYWRRYSLVFVGEIRSLYHFVLSDHMLQLVGSGVLGCPGSEAAPGVRCTLLGSLDGQALLSISGGSCSGRSCVPSCRGRNNTLLLQGVRGCIGSISGTLPIVGS